ncbi:DsbA family oxidoreductase [Aidingimonas halophila]|uniref:Predicted dithiol-disulfide isomerase, DsbA family n=1 Tax=Aidingimonas halophila TaxID=574349 RepID=A0A1H3GQ46_9GAMM|nr:DsbA family oxidoreductase [Aidingimonas halophila]GHC35686.1 polyketide biosynthesis protein [Aidingimonas halophila]SDY05095.1 Predicted dithiol-disulfide isomerase, DsbA family [Aidingimonas halophila]
MSHVDITVISDAICPWCFIGKRHLDLALAELPEEIGVSVAWHPFELNPDMPAEGLSRRDYRTAKFGSWERSQALDAQVEAAATQAGLEIHHERMTRTPNTFNAHRLIWLAGEHGFQSAVVDALFRYYFVEGQDIGDSAVLANAALDGGLVGIDIPAFLAGDQGRSEVRAGLDEARRLGVSGVPTFIIDDTVDLSGAQPPETLRQAILETTDKR